MKNKFDGKDYFKKLKEDAQKTLKNVEIELADDMKNKHKSKGGDKK